MPYLALSQQPDARLRAGVPDIRGFEVRTRADDAGVGRVADVIVDASGQPHFVAVDVVTGARARHVLLPATRLVVDAPGRLAWVSELRREQVDQLPDYDGDPRRIGGATPAAAAAPVAAAPAAGEDVRVTLSEEQLSLGTRAVQAGEVGIRKTVETERVRRTVPVMREEVTIERRPATGMDAATARVEVTEDEIRIPIFGEEVVVEKRVVAREEFIVRKREVTETRTVEADVQRERLNVTRDVDAG